MTVYNSYVPTDTHLYPGDGISSPNGVYWFVLQGAGDINVVYTGSFGTGGDAAVWASPPPATNLGGFFDHMQGDGNFVEYTSATGLDEGTVVPVWATNTSGSPGNYFASLSDSGEFAVYQGTDPAHAGSKLFSNGVDNPVTGINLTSLTYDIAGATIGSPDAISGIPATLTNMTPIEQSYPISLTLSYTKTNSWSWDLSESLTLGVKSTTDVGVPGLAKESVEVEVSETTTLSAGESGSVSETRTFTGGNTVSVPARSVYESTIVAQHVKFNVPYTFEGIATYKSGDIGTVNGSGIFNGGDATIFQITTSCISTPGGCDSAVPPPILPALPTPEPTALLLLSTALVAAAVLMVFDPSLSRRLRPFCRTVSEP